MVESARHRSGLLMWILFVAASLPILVMTSSLIRNTSSSYAGITMDELGGALPFGLSAAVATYLLLKPKRIKKPPVRAAGRAILKTQQMVLIMAVGIFLVTIYFILTFIPFPLEIVGGGLAGSSHSGEYNLANLPIFNPVLASSIIVIGAIFVVALLATFLRTKTEAFDETPEEETVGRGAIPIPGRIIDDEHRKAIIERYVKGRDVLIVQGVPMSESTTHREFEDNVLQSAKIASNDFVPLSRLFEEARFSSHLVGEPQKNEADRRYEKIVKTASKQRVEDD